MSSATARRERRRLSLAARVVVDELVKSSLLHRFEGLVEDLAASVERISVQIGLVLDSCSALEGRVQRTEALLVTGPSVDEVLEEMLAKKKRVPVQAPLVVPSVHDMTTLDTDDECATVFSGSAAPEATVGEATTIDLEVRAEVHWSAAFDGYADDGFACPVGTLKDREQE